MDWKINHFRLTTMKSVKTVPVRSPHTATSSCLLQEWLVLTGSWACRSQFGHESSGHPLDIKTGGLRNISLLPGELWRPAMCRKTRASKELDGVLSEAKSLVPEDPKAYPFDPYLVGLTWQYHFFTGRSCLHHLSSYSRHVMGKGAVSLSQTGRCQQKWTTFLGRIYKVNPLNCRSAGCFECRNLHSNACFLGGNNPK